MAAPGNITSPYSEGCNNLIKRGALAVTDVKDIIEELGLNTNSKQTALPLGDTADEHIILTLLGAGENDGEILQKQSKLTPDVFSQTLTMLEITGKIRALGANKWAIK